VVQIAVPTELRRILTVPGFSTRIHKWLISGTAYLPKGEWQSMGAFLILVALERQPGVLAKS
jgi:hypothetical protein